VGRGSDIVGAVPDRIPFLESSKSSRKGGGVDEKLVEKNFKKGPTRGKKVGLYSHCEGQDQLYQFGGEKVLGRGNNQVLLL